MISKHHGRQHNLALLREYCISSIY
ncbi:MAG: hypothetical protein M0P54_07335 [Bacteroidales bacterium]|nr:hypothetical protein [Bacteroidales bacterium]